MMTKQIVTFLCAVSMMMAVGARAATCTWTNTAEGSWDITDADNWDTLPTLSDQVRFDKPMTNTLTATANLDIAQMVFAAVPQHLTLNLSPYGITIHTNANNSVTYSAIDSEFILASGTFVARANVFAVQNARRNTFTVKGSSVFGGAETANFGTGANSTNNTLRFIENSTGTFGLLTIGTGAGNHYNTVQLDGPGVLVTLTNGHDTVAHVGHNNASWNTLEIRNGAKLVRTAGAFFIGSAHAGSNSNGLVMVNGTFDNGSLRFGVGKAPSVGNCISLTDSSTITCGTFVVGDGGTFSSATLTNSTLRLGGLFFGLGANSTNNTMEITKGSTVYCTSLDMARDVVGKDSNDRLTIRDSGSFLDISGKGYIGSRGSSETLEVLDGAKLFATNSPAGAIAFNIGGNATHTAPVNVTNNVLRLRNGGVFEARREIKLGGADGNDNTMAFANRIEVLEGSVVIAGNDGGRALGIGYLTNSWNNEVRIVDSIWTNVSGSIVMDKGHDNRIVLDNGVLYAHAVHLGNAVSGTNNTIVLQGTNSHFRASSLVVSYTGSGLVFNVPRKGYANPKTPVVEIMGAWTHALDARLEVNASDWAKRTGGELTLLTHVGTLTAGGRTLQDIVNGIAKDPTTDYSIDVHGQSIVLTAPRKQKTVLLLR